MYQMKTIYYLFFLLVPAIVHGQVSSTYKFSFNPAVVIKGYTKVDPGKVYSELKDPAKRI
jgi:hypothetical protein